MALKLTKVERTFLTKAKNLKFQKIKSLLLNTTLPVNVSPIPGLKATHSPIIGEITINSLIFSKNVSKITQHPHLLTILAKTPAKFSKSRAPEVRLLTILRDFTSRLYLGKRAQPP